MLESLKYVEYINGKKVMTNDMRPCDGKGNVDWYAFDVMREKYPICVDHSKDMISFKIMTKPAKEGGDLRNCQWIDLVATGLHILKYLNEDYPCHENMMTINKLEEALMWQEKRTRDRLARKVEGYYKA